MARGAITCCLACNLVLVDRYTVGKITPVPMREIRSCNFGGHARIKMYFPREGSQITPSHHSIDFYWKDYCHMVFRKLRELFKLDAADYMMSICGGDGQRELSVHEISLHRIEINLLLVHGSLLIWIMLHL